jgi:hypothetical protein
MIDVDLKNALANFEWDAIREAVSEFIPELLPWTEWCHREAAQVYLPSGGCMQVARGAEQDPLGSLYCGLALAMVSERTKERLRAAGSIAGDQELPYVGAWYMDDGQLICRPSFVDPLLRAFEAEAAKVGATRGSKAFGCEVKSAVKLIGTPKLCSTPATTGPPRTSATLVKSTTAALPATCSAWISGLAPGSHNSLASSWRSRSFMGPSAPGDTASELALLAPTLARSHTCSELPGPTSPPRNWLP